MRTAHVVPLRDLIAHEVPGGIDTDEAPALSWLAVEAPAGAAPVRCACSPTAEIVRTDSGTILGRRLVHHSLDGRELFE